MLAMFVVKERLCEKVAGGINARALSLSVNGRKKHRWASNAFTGLAINKKRRPLC